MAMSVFYFGALLAYCIQVQLPASNSSDAFYLARVFPNNIYIQANLLRVLDRDASSTHFGFVFIAKNKQIQEQLKQLHHCAKNSEEPDRVFYSICNFYFQRSQFAEAIQTSRTVLRLQMTSPYRYYELLACCASCQELWTEALKWINQAEPGYRNSADYYVKRGYIHQRIGNVLLAWGDYSNALKIDINDHEARLGRALIALHLKELQLALHDSRILLQTMKYQKDETVNFLHACVLWRLGETLEANDRFNLALKLCPQEYRVVFERVMMEVKGIPLSDVILLNIYDLPADQERARIKARDLSLQLLAIPDDLGLIIKETRVTPETFLPQKLPFTRP